MPDQRGNALSLAPPADELSLRADVSEMGRASEWVEARCLEQGVPPEQVSRLLLCLDEAFANVLDHGGPVALSHPVRFQFETHADAESRTATVTVSDAGPAFDPVSAPDKALPKTLDEASSRGRGLQMIRAIATVLRYRRDAGHNHLTFGTSWAPK